MNTAQEGNTVTVHYTGTLKDGTQFDSSRNKTPLSFKIGAGQVIPGFNDGILGMTPGDTKTITIDHKNAYGPKIKEAIQEVPKTKFPPDFEVRVGQTVAGQNPNGQPFNATIVSEQSETITLDFNHPLAGEDLTFEVELLTVT
jgi:peptidylprolyl isomerase